MANQGEANGNGLAPGPVPAPTDLDDARKQLAATGEVLRAIASSRGDVDRVLETIAVTTQRLFDSSAAAITRIEDGVFRQTAAAGPDAETIPPVSLGIKVDTESVIGKAAVEKRTIAVEDITVERGDYPTTASVLARSGIRSICATPLIREGEAIGTLSIRFSDVRSLSANQIELLETFADQAVIAIENARLFNAEQQRARELAETLERQTASAEILRVIASSPGDADLVLGKIANTALGLIGGVRSTVTRIEGDTFLEVSTAGPKASSVRGLMSGLKVDRSSVSGRAATDKKTVHVGDVREQGNESFAASRELSDQVGSRTVCATPLLSGGTAIGTISIVRETAEPLTRDEIGLLESFADQAVIAIENARLLEELRESLQQQTATSEVLEVISGSPRDLTPVFTTLLENAVRLCGAKFGNLWLREGDGYRIAAIHGAPAAYEEHMYREPLVHPNPQSPMTQIVRTKRPFQINDLGSLETTPTPIKELAGARTVFAVPMLKDDEVVGLISIYRQEVRAFSDQQIDLVTNFARQAVIAIENARLLEELRTRMGELDEALAQQTATSEVLRIIARSPGNLEPVLDTMLANATKLCEAGFGILWLNEGDRFRLGGLHNTPSAHANALGREPYLVPHPEAPLGQVARTKKVFHTADVRELAPFAQGDQALVDFAVLSGARSVVSVPMLKDGDLVGVISIFRQEVRPFADKQIDLLASFADQAVIAIENVRLFEEVEARTHQLSETLEQLTATSEILRVISTSPTDVQPVFETIVRSAVSLCDGLFANLFRYDGEVLHFVATHNVGPQYEKILSAKYPMRPDTSQVSGRVILTKSVVRLEDATADPEYDKRFPKAMDWRRVLGVPMLRDGEPLGVIVVGWAEAGPVPKAQEELLKTFADQAIIAIENVRLFEEVEARTQELTRSLEDLRTAQDRLVQTEKLASLGQLTAGIAHEIKNPLNFVNNFSALSIELVDELGEALKRFAVDLEMRSEIDELSTMLRGNLDKIVEHGKRADSIVKNMLLHSRAGSGEHRPVDINAIVEESLNLAYHGARAERSGFNITLESSLDSTAGMVDLYPQEITRVLLNLISNGFYATTKRKELEGDGAYEPLLTATTRDLGGSVEIRIRDNGTGIPPDAHANLFSPFFTTKPVGEGTGLGLSLSHDIVVKQHSGTIEVDTEPGAFTEFRIVLPREAASLGESGGQP